MPLNRIRRFLAQRRRRQLQRASSELNLRYRWCLPEFRALTDEEFYAMTGDAQLRDRKPGWWTTAVLPYSVVWGTVVVLSFAALLGLYSYGELSLLALLLALVPSVGGVILPALVIGVWLIRRAAKREVLAVFIPTNCPSCQFEILGLAPSGGTIACPECGHLTNTHGRRWAAERARPTLATTRSGGKRRKRRKRFAR